MSHDAIMEFSSDYMTETTSALADESSDLKTALILGSAEQKNDVLTPEMTVENAVSCLAEIFFL